MTPEMTQSLLSVTISDEGGTYASTNVSESGALNWPTINMIDRFVTPVWYVVGIPGNVIACVVWMQRQMRQSSGFYLAALALDECLFLILQMLYELETRWHVTILQLPGVCESFPVLFLTTQYLSPLLVLAFTVERYISVCHPFQRERFSTTRRTVVTIGALVFGTMCMHAVQGYFWKYYPATPSSPAGECRVRPEVMDNGASSVWSIWSWVTEMAVFGVVPLAILVINILVIRETRHLSASDILRCPKPVQLDASCGSGAKRKDGRGRDGNITASSRLHPTPTSHRPASATTFTLLAVSFYLIATTLPVTICYVLVLSFPEGSQTISDSNGGEARWSDSTWSRNYIYRGVRTVVEEFGMSHYAFNLFIYLATVYLPVYLPGNRAHVPSRAVPTHGTSQSVSSRPRRSGEQNCN